MARKLRLTSLQGRLLWLLEEAGAADFRLLVASLRPATVADTESAISVLRQIDAVRFYRQGGRGLSYVELDEDESLRLPPLAELIETCDARAEGLLLTEKGRMLLTT